LFFLATFVLKRCDIFLFFPVGADKFPLQIILLVSSALQRFTLELSEAF